MGLEKQLVKVFSGICEQWPRCKAAAEAEFIGFGKHEEFQRVRRRCRDWLDTGVALPGCTVTLFDTISNHLKC